MLLHYQSKSLDQCKQTATQGQKPEELIQFLSLSVTRFTLYTLIYSLKSYKNIVQLDAIHIYTQ